jgi:hypothetical protein
MKRGPGWQESPPETRVGINDLELVYTVSYSRYGEFYSYLDQVIQRNSSPLINFP